MKKIIIIILFLLVIIPVSFFVLKPQYIKLHNSKVDYSCEIDSDCVVKKTGCSCCGDTYACVNVDSTEGWCELSPNAIVCDCIEPRQFDCGCIDNKCQSEPKWQ